MQHSSHLRCSKTFAISAELCICFWALIEAFLSILRFLLNRPAPYLGCYHSAFILSARRLSFFVMLGTHIRLKSCPKRGSINELMAASSSCPGEHSSSCDGRQNLRSLASCRTLQQELYLAAPIAIVHCAAGCHQRSASSFAHRALRFITVVYWTYSCLCNSSLGLRERNFLETRWLQMGHWRQIPPRTCIYSDYYP